MVVQSQKRKNQPRSGVAFLFRPSWKYLDSRRPIQLNRKISFPPKINYSLAWFALIACCNFFISSGESLGRSIIIVTLFSLPVKVNGEE
jgi:hypothetical protein